MQPVAIPWRTAHIAVEAWNQFVGRGDYNILRHLVNLFFYAAKNGTTGYKMPNPIHPLTVEVLSMCKIIIYGVEYWLVKVDGDMIEINRKVFEV